MVVSATISRLADCHAVFRDIHTETFARNKLFKWLICLSPDDAVYNASQAALGGGGGTLDKRGGLRDELGYIAPPNRKLPPVPGSNYNTCDRVNRQAVISKCYTFHGVRVSVLRTDRFEDRSC